nr:hypothetical protein [Pseudoscardovia suis]
MHGAAARWNGRGESAGKLTITVAGATGYAGGEALRILTRHPYFCAASLFWSAEPRIGNAFRGQARRRCPRCRLLRCRDIIACECDRGERVRGVVLTWY